MGSSAVQVSDLVSGGYSGLGGLLWGATGQDWLRRIQVSNLGWGRVVGVFGVIGPYALRLDTS